jgi:hypothetical protein
VRAQGTDSYQDVHQLADANDIRRFDGRNVATW